jgi:hypothetical protein
MSNFKKINHGLPLCQNNPNGVYLFFNETLCICFYFWHNLNTRNTFSAQKEEREVVYKIFILFSLTDRDKSNFILLTF